MKRHYDHRIWLAKIKADKDACRAREKERRERAATERASKPVGDTRRLLAIIAAIGGAA